MGEPAPEDFDDDLDDDGVCPNYGGEGEVESCFEDTCVCTDPPCCWSKCDWCNGKG